MLAITYHGPKDVRVETVADPTPQDLAAAVVKVKACGICGSDLHIYDGHGFSTDIGFCVGHESVGEVIEVGSAVSSFSVGDRVLVPGSTGCNTCRQCRQGSVFSCENGNADVYGLSHRLQGSQAEAVAVPFADSNLSHIPEAVSNEAALMLTDNAPPAWMGARRAGITPGQSVAVIGLGPVGILSVMAAQIMGAGTVYAIDLVESRRHLAASIGAIAIDPANAAEIIMDHGGALPDVVLEAVGLDQTITAGIKLVRPHGTVSVVGVNKNMDFSFPMHLAQLKSLHFVINLCSAQRELPTLMPLVESGRLDPSVVVSHRMGLSEGVEAYALYASREDGVNKVILDPSR